MGPLVLAVESPAGALKVFDFELVPHEVTVKLKMIRVTSENTDFFIRTSKLPCSEVG